MSADYEKIGALGFAIMISVIKSASGRCDCGRTEPWERLQTFGHQQLRVSPLIIDNLEDPASILLDETSTAEFTRCAKNDGHPVGLGSGIGHTSATTPG